MMPKAKKAHVHYYAGKNAYRVCLGRKTLFSYSVGRYGEYAKVLAEMSLADNKRYENYFVENDDGTVTFFAKHKGESKEIIVDAEDAEKLHDKRICVAQDRRNFYAVFYEGTKQWKLHRFVMDVDDKNIIIDHIDRNGLNNSKQNLRIVSVSANARNARLNSRNKTGYKGIVTVENGKRFVVRWRSLEGKECSKCFSTINFSDEETALQAAVKFRDSVYEKTNYIA